MKNVLYRALALIAIGGMGIGAACNEGVVEPDREPTPSGGGGSPNPPTIPRGNAPAVISAVSGGGQTARTFDLLAEPFVVAVVDDRGIRVEGVAVTWQLVKGTGTASDISITDADGRAAMTYRAGNLGRDIVEARVDGVLQAVQFTVDTSIIAIDIISGLFIAYGSTDPAPVPLGIPVEFKNLDSEEHRIQFLSVPPGGTAIDSPILGTGDTYFFLPDVPGSWTYACDIHPEAPAAVLDVE